MGGRDPSTGVIPMMALTESCKEKQNSDFNTGTPIADAEILRGISSSTKVIYSDYSASSPLKAS